MAAERSMRPALLALVMTVTTATIIMADEATELAQLAARIAALEEAVAAVRLPVAENRVRVQAIAERLARGEDPLVTLEIEALWRVIRSIEEELGQLREQTGVVGR